MPKIIENVRQILLEEAKRQIKENGYGGTTIRSVAGACNLGVGTVYNYFDSKDMLIATFMLEDWLECLGEMKRHSGEDSGEFITHVYDVLREFVVKHQDLFGDKEAAKAFAGVFSDRHRQLRGQIAELLLPICEKAEGDKIFLAEFIAESLLTWTVAGRPMEDILPVLEKLLK